VRLYIADFSIFENEAKNSKNVKPIAFTFRPFLADFSILKMRQKTEKK
jgi:hypothetical protein